MTRKQMRLGVLAGGVAVFSAGIGIGGGAILVPALVHLGRYEFRRASSLSLATIAPISLVGAVTHALLLDGNFPLGMLSMFLIAGALGVAIGSMLLERVPTPGFTIAFAAFLVVVGIKMTTGWHLAGVSLHAMESSLSPYPFLAIAVFGVAIGFTSSLLGVGGGLVIVPFCVYGLGLDIHVAITFSLTTMFFLTSAGAIGRFRKGLLDVPAASRMIPASLAGAVLGAAISSQLSDVLLRQSFGAFLLVLGTKHLIEDTSRILAKRMETVRHAELHD